MKDMGTAAQPALFEREPVLVQRKGRRPRKSPAGISTNDLVFTASVGGNADMFPSILSLYVPPGSTVADVTFGKGVFWKNVPPSLYKLLATDIRKGVDSRRLPYKDEALGCVVFDPPYMHTPGGTAHDGHQNFEQYYKNNGDNLADMRPIADLPAGIISLGKAKK